jgi:glutathione S-transferase
MSLQLVFGNKNYSSWSMRPWVLMQQLGIAFEEIKLRFDFSEGSPFRTAVARYSPAGRVPVLIDNSVAGGLAVWDTLAITEYLHERFPQAGVWPTNAADRARARSVVCEMHSGFSALRSHCPMNIEAHFPEVGQRVMAEQEGVRNDLARIESIWAEALRRSGGPMLFGPFSAADAFFAPVCMRIRGYALPVSDLSRAYIERVVALPSVKRWIDDALAEHDFIAEDEPYRQTR